MTTTSPPSRWVKSTYSPENGGNCIEWAPAHASETGAVPVRDSKCPTGPTLAVSPGAWAGLVSLARSADV
ncbi:DUF397 domain-containing protein [Streptomyces sp. NPDC057638]|uniref:DUF397 domain-containing protein n=1 Tax=Streptomyces sp. NPDC057638 TaxID=3346190 RepID=UPI0036A855A2